MQAVKYIVFVNHSHRSGVKPGYKEPLLDGGYAQPGWNVLRCETQEQYERQIERLNGFEHCEILHCDLHI